MQPPMLVRARSCLPLLLASTLACRAGEPVPADCDIGRDERESLEKDIASLEAEKQRLTKELETERGCREQLLGSLTAFAEGPYDEVVAEFAENAKQLLEARVAKRKKGEKLAIVLDVDETVLSNFEQLRGSGYCFVRDDWNEWVDVGVPVELAGIRPLYDYAREHEVAVVFLSGRKEAQREDTERVLKSAGFEHWEHVLLRDPSEDELTAAEFKSGRRAKLEEQGYTVVLSVGDQQSDLDGGHAEHAVLIPNPFYFVK
jgi:5'-nucleotidase (lipoprotein e(P4) family)